MTDQYDDMSVGDYDEVDALSRGDSADRLSTGDAEYATLAGASDVSSQSGLDTVEDDEDERPDCALQLGAGASATISLGEAVLNDIKTSLVAAEQRSGKQSQGKATDCCVCGTRALYTCPSCGRRTCSMTCVRVHKRDFNCSGERDVAAKIPLSEFTDEQLERDYHFLENCRRVVDNVERSFPRLSWRFTYKALPPPLHALREAARRRGVICQITSEGMRRREVNTSRLDRKTNTIVWRCEFQFVDARHPNEPVTIGTNWGSERHRLGDIMKYCWATNPPLLCYHINRQYNKASTYVEGAQRKGGKAEGAEEEGGAADAGVDTVRHSAEEGDGLNHMSTALDDNNEGGEETKASATPAAEVEVQSASQSVTADGTQGGPQEAQGSTDSLNAHQLPTSELVHLYAYEEVPPMPLIEPFSPEEAEQQAYVNSFLQHERYVILSKAERLGNETKYFQLHPHETLNENLRLLFFVNEFPVFVVVHVSLLDRFPLVTGEDKERIRGSFRSKKVHEPKEKVPARKRSDMQPEELERLSKVPCRRFLHSRCQLGEECPYWHCTPEEIPACRSLLRTGQCDKGPRCSFRHDPDAVRLARKRQREDGSRRGGRGGGRGRGRGGFRGPQRRMN
ncbi:hypothetical protein ABL78_2617 [Leptomonas seymouri]|uniref:HIT-type domain-containing protein n=1 Tax=Leptomonas seymouri TaxID=5684 RepID=A0A0N1I0N9_LEPSE|nr:hypothetical protein ABL78_2617 [Leptomonas seymouri]|eukprot:KPI88318.1 hypothetical protein ABL78_2617 [Leptomonas seymouri]